MEEYIRKYRKLLQEESSDGNFIKSVQLLKNILCSIVESTIEKEFDEIKNVSEADSELAGIFRWSKHKSIQLDNVSDIFAECKTSLLVVPNFLYSNISKIDEQSYSLAMDTTGVIFHNAYFSILDRVSNGEEKNKLIGILLEYTNYINSASEMFYSKGLCFSAAGNEPEALSSFENSVLSAHSDQHEFMTLIENYWAELLDRSKFEEAVSFLLKIQNRVLYKDMEELQNYILETFRIQSQHSN